jgi:hypothetical protein
MRAEEPDLQELLELEPEGGVIRLGGQRAFPLDAAAVCGLSPVVLQPLHGDRRLHRAATQPLEPDAMRAESGPGTRIC